MKVRKEKQVPFTMVSNDPLNDKEISLKAKGLYSYMESKPDNWNFTIRSMAKQMPDGRDSITTAMQELKDAGYITYTKKSDGTGEYVLSQRRKTRRRENPKEGKPDPINKKDLNSNKDLRINKEAEQIKDLPIDLQEEIEFNISAKDNKTKRKRSAAKKKELLSDMVADMRTRKGYYIGIAQSFQVMFKTNLLELNIPTKNVDEANSTWVDQIRLMHDTDKYDRKDFEDVYIFLSKSEFWKPNVQSVPKLRQKFQTILAQARSRPNKAITPNSMEDALKKQKDYQEMLNE